VPEVNRSVLVGFTPEQMFGLVDAVEDYPKFLPWCGGAAVLHRDERITRAKITINYHGIRQGFTTENTKRPPTEMRICLVEGPFRSLDGCWRFTGLAGRGCKVELGLRYEFSSRSWKNWSGRCSTISPTRWSMLSRGAPSRSMADYTGDG